MGEHSRLASVQPHDLADGKSEGSEAGAVALEEGDIEKGQGQGQSAGKFCTICLGGYEDGDVVNTLPCQHQFHKECIVEWLGFNGVCPICKRSIKKT